MNVLETIRDTRLGEEVLLARSASGPENHDLSSGRINVRVLMQGAK